MTTASPSEIRPIWSCWIPSDAAMAVAEVAYPLLGIKRGRRSFSRAAPCLYPPN